MPSAALEGLRVLEVAGERGEYCGKLLGDLGADVIKIEPPEGSVTRRRGPFVADRPDRDGSLHFAYYNTNKRGITLGLAAKSGRFLFRRLLDQADVLVDGMDPTYLDGLGLGEATLRSTRPELIYASVTPFGQWGPHRDDAGDELVAFAMGGFLFISGQQDGRPLVGPGQQATDLGGLHAAAGVLMALENRPAASGQAISVSMREVLASEEHLIERYTFAGTSVRREGSQHGTAAPGRIYPARDGFIHLFIAQPEKWRAFFRLLGGPEMLSDEVWNDPPFRRANVDILNPLVASWSAQRSRRKIVDAAQARALPTGSVNTPREFIDSPQSAQRGLFPVADHALWGTCRFPGGPYQLSDSPWALRRAAPALGQHNEEIYLGELGLSRPEMLALRANGVI
ncbi:MAG: CoA transferase [Chloroflexi bacterium]|nr:CoA transferase [Chloroflexota bacterium]